MEEFVWYATYGSNYYLERFKLYIEGGEIPSIPRLHEGSCDLQLPIEDELIIIPYRTYFSQKVNFWQGKGVAFLDDKINSGQSFSRIYKIKKTQFIDVFAQENGVSPNDFNENIDWSIKEGKSLNIGDESELVWYGKLMRLKDVEGMPVFTFTTKTNDFKRNSTKPGKNYLAIISAGLRQKGLSNDEISDYLMGLDPLCIDDNELISESIEYSISLE